MSTLGGYPDKCGGRSLGKQLNLYGNPSVLNIPGGTHDIPHNHHGIPQCTHDIPRCTAHPPVYCTDIMQGDIQRSLKLNCSNDLLAHSVTGYTLILRLHVANIKAQV